MGVLFFALAWLLYRTAMKKTVAINTEETKDYVKDIK